MTESVLDPGPKWSHNDWEDNFWKAGWTPWHKASTYPNLRKYYDHAFGGNSKSRIYVPLCGKTVDLMWLAKKGHEVVGLDLSEVAVKAFFNEQSLHYEKSEVPGSKLVKYKAKEVNITVYKGDFFHGTAEVLGVFDGAWDRGAITSMHPKGDDRTRYLKTMKSLLTKNASYLVNSYFHDVELQRPPYSLDPKTLCKLCDGLFDYESLYEGEYEASFASIKETVCLLTPK